MLPEKACIKVLEGCTAGGVSFNKDEKLQVQFNPERYSVSTSLSYSFAKKEDKLYAQYTGEESRSLSVELFFDMLSVSSVYQRQPPIPGNGTGLEKRMDNAGAVSAAYVSRILALTKPSKERGAPPMVTFMWGGESFKGVISSANLEYVMFNGKGEPTRATVQLTLNECDDIMATGKDTELKLNQAAGASGGLDALEEAGGELEVKEAVIKAVKLLSN